MPVHPWIQLAPTLLEALAVPCLYARLSLLCPIWLAPSSFLVTGQTLNLCRYTANLGVDKQIWGKYLRLYCNSSNLARHCSYDVDYCIFNGNPFLSFLSLHYVSISHWMKKKCEWIWSQTSFWARLVPCNIPSTLTYFVEILIYHKASVTSLF